MKKNDQELDEFLRKEKAYFEQQKLLRAKVNLGRGQNHKSISQDSKLPNHLSLKSDSAQMQQQFIKVMQDGPNIYNQSTANQYISNQYINVNPQISLNQVSPTQASSSKTENYNKQSYYHNTVRDSQQSSFKQIINNISSSQIDATRSHQTIGEFNEQYNYNKKTKTNEKDKQERTYLPRDQQIFSQYDLLSRNSSLIVPKSSQSSKNKHIKTDNYNIFTSTSTVNLDKKRNSLSNTIFFTPLQSRPLTPTSTQIYTKNDISIEASEVPKSQNNLQKSLNSLNLTAHIHKLQNSHVQQRNTLKRITQNEPTNQSLNGASQNRIPSQNKLPSSLIEDKNIQIESTILTANKAQMMEQLKVKCNNNFYGKFIQHALSQESNNIQKEMNNQFHSSQNICQSPVKSQQKGSQKQSLSNQNSPRVTNSSTPYETNICQIKAKLSMQLLELVKSDFYGSNDNNDRDEQSPLAQRDWKFQKLQFPNEEHYSKKFDRISRNIVTKRENNLQLQQKLFQILQNKEQIVIHTSQNKDLMNISERKDIVSLVKWYEDMLNSIYNQTTSPNALPSPLDVTYSKIFSDLQAVHQACISEIIRQVSIHCVERGQLLKKVQENLMSLLREAFTRQLDEKVTFQKDIQKEVQIVHKDCIEKIEYYIPIIAGLTDQLDKKDAINKRILLEFRYLKKKNHKLEKFLKEGRKDYKNLHDNYTTVSKQLDELKQHHIQISYKQEQDQQKMSDNFIKKLDEVTRETAQQQQIQLSKMKKENQLLKDIQIKYENDQKQISQQYNIAQQEIDELEEIAQKEEFSTNLVCNNQGQQSQRKPASENMLTTERQIIEIEALDGLRFVLASVGVQVDNDLIQRKEAQTETRSYFTTNENQAQTEIEIPKQFHTSSSQTPLEWLKQQQKEKETQKPSQNSLSLLNEDSLLKKISQLSLEKSSLKLEGIDRIMSDSPVNRYLSSPESANKFNIFMEAISDDKVELKSDDEDIYREEDQESINRGSLSQIDEVVENREDQFQTIKFKQTLENTLRASIENDISDLHLILHSKQRFVLDVFQKIIDHQLLKENPHLKYEELKLFIEDSLAFKYEENLRFRNIWNKCKLQLIQYVKSKISLAEKQVEIEEANKNLDFGNGLYEKLITEYESVLEQISSNSKKINTTKRGSNGTILSASIKSIIFETSDNEDETAKASQNKDENSSQLKSPAKDIQDQEIVQQSLRKSRLKNSLKDNKSQSPASKGKRQISQPNIKSKIAIAQTKQNISEKIIEQHNENKIKGATDEIEGIEGEIEIEPFQQKSSIKGKQKFSKIVNMVMNGKNKAAQKQQLQVPSNNSNINNNNNDQPDTISDDIIQRSILSQKSQTFDLFKNYRFKKHKLRKKYGLQSSPNQDAASNFLSTIGYKIMNNRTMKMKGAVFTEQNTRRYISQIYNDKIKQIKSQDKSNPLHNVAYDFFLNKFGFKNIAEKNLQQLLRSLQYHNHIDRMKMFLRFFGIDHEINYDIDDFNFYINCLIHLDDNLSPLFQQLFIYSIPKVSELLFKKFENKITNKILNKIKSDIEQMKYSTNDPSLKNKNVIDQDQALQCLLSAKVEEKKVNIIALRPIYLAGDVDNDQVIGYDEFMMLARHIERGMSLLSIMQLFFYNTDMIDEITNEKTMSFQQFAQISVENNLFNQDKQQTYLLDVEEWDLIKNISLLKKQWNQKKDILRLRFVKTKSYKNFYRLMIQKIEDYFQSSNNNQIESYFNQQKSSLSRLPPIQSIPTQNSHPSLVNLDESIYTPLPKSLKSQNQIPAQVLQQLDQEEQEKQNVTWLLYKLLDDESKRVIVDSQMESLIPNEFHCIVNKIEDLASENKFFILSHKTKDQPQS